MWVSQDIHQREVEQYRDRVLKCDYKKGTDDLMQWSAAGSWGDQLIQWKWVQWELEGRFQTETLSLNALLSEKKEKDSRIVEGIVLGVAAKG